MADVKKVVDFETPEQFKQMGNDIVAMSRKIPMAATELAKIVALGGQSGIAQNDLMRFTDSAAKMGVAFDISAERAGQSMAELRSAFKLDQSGVETLADKINYLGNTTPAAAKGIMEIVQRVGAFGTVAGYNTGTVAALGATMRGFGIQEEIAATSIKNMMLALVAGETATKSQKAAWKKLGFDHEQIAKDMQKDAEGTTLKVLEAVSKLEKYKQASTLKELFGSESLLGIAPLLTSIDTVKKNLEGVKSAANFDGSMNKEYEARAATTANNIQLLKNSLTGLGITVGTMLLPAVNRFVVLSTSVVNALTDWAQQHPVLTQAIVGTTAAILALIMSWSPLASFVAVFSSLFAWFAGLPATFAAYGGMMIDGLVNGIKAKIGAAVGAVQSLAARIKGAFTSPKSMDIHSPSRVFRSYGGYITEGLALGVNSGAAHPLNRIGQLAGSLKERFAGRMCGFNSDLSARLSANADTLAQARSAANTQAAANHANGAITIHFNPTINAQGGNLQQIETALQMSLREFEELFKRMMADKARRAY